LVLCSEVWIDKNVLIKSKGYVIIEVAIPDNPPQINFF